MNHIRPAIALLILSLVSAPAHAQERLSGSWRGYWSRAGDSMLVTLHIQRDTAGRYSATFDAERLRVSGIPFNEVRVDGCCDVTMVLRGDRTTATFTGKLAGDSLTGALRETIEGDGRFAYVRASSSGPAFEERDVTFASGDVTLAGTLLLPRSGNKLPAVVFLHGSGPEGRWGSRFLASQLASRGIAALIFDKRGVGKSAGDWRGATLDDLAADGAAAIEFLCKQPRIDSTRVGLHGHSQGGTLAPFVAARARGVAFIIGSAAAGTPTDSTEIYSILNSLLPRATSAEDSASARAYIGELVTVAYHMKPRTRLDSLANAMRGKPWFLPPPADDNPYWAFSREFGQYQALEWWSKTKVPVLLLYGGADQRVPAAESARRIEAALKRAGNRNLTVRIYPGADHTFRMPPGRGGWPVTAPNYVADLLNWLAKR